MLSRWFHPPALHSPAPGKERKVGWLELFYDLIYVATIIQLGSALSENVGVAGGLAFAGLFVPIWYTWTGFTFYSNRFVVDDVLHRGLVFLQMFGVGAMAVTVPRVFAGDTQAFALAYAGVRITLVLMYFRSYRQVADAREMTGRYALGFTAGAALWLASAFLPTPWVFVAWALAMGADLSVPFSRQSRELIGRYPPDVLHMTERYGLFIIIVLGEAFVKVLTILAEEGATPDHAMMAALSATITFSLWWIYFDDVAGSRIRGKPLAVWIWIYSHLPLTIAVTAVGVAIKKAVLFDVFEPADAKYRYMLCIVLGLALLSVGVIDAVTERRQAELSDRARVNVRAVSAFLVLFLAPVGAFVPAWAFVAMVASACVLQVLFDLSMAPLAADHHEVHEGEQAGISRSTRPPGPETVPPRRRRSLGEAIRKGTPSELRRDLYFHFMEGSWWRLFFSVGVVYLVGNGVFAGLYVLDPTGIANVRAGSFPDAFFFSVQTMSTIGYGTMTPSSTYANLLVTVEAAIALLGVALVTGLVFAKASRPRLSVLFSRHVVVTRYNGQRALMFRAGNARGNEVVEANMRVSVLQDEVSPEGHRMRRLRDLPLVRDNSPIFALTWTVIHIIDEASPLHGLNEANAADKVVTLLATMTGYDATYAQNTHARTMYYPEDLRFDYRFIDVLSTLEDGRLMIDYDRFHDVEPEPA